MSSLCVLIALIISGNGIWLYSQPQSSDSPQEAGKIVEIKCIGFIKKAGSSTEDPLDPERDKDRILYAGDAVKCVGEGQMKIEVYKRSHEIDQTDLWYPIPEPNKESSGPGRVGALRGTYQLDLERTHGSSTAALGSVPYAWRPALDTPFAMAIDLNGDTVTIVSSAFSKFAFKADGSMHKFVTGDGETIQTFATIEDGRLIIKSSTDRNRRLEAIFSPQKDGDLKLTSEISFGDMREPAVMKATYQRTSMSAQLDEFRQGVELARHSEAATGNRAAATAILAAFDDDLSTDSAREGSVITLTVQEPELYRGAKVQARVSSVGPSGMLVLTFESINVPAGKSYRLVAPHEGQALAATAAATESPTGKIVAGQTDERIEVGEAILIRTTAPGAVYKSPQPILTLKKGTVILIRNSP